MGPHEPCDPVQPAEPGNGQCRRPPCLAAALTIRQPGSEARLAGRSRTAPHRPHPLRPARSEEHTSELQSLMRISYAVFCLKTTTIERQTCHTLDRYVRIQDG